MRRYRTKLFGFVMVILTGLTGIIQYSLEDNVQLIRRVPTTHKIVALTIDDGPHSKTTPEILAVLREKQVKLTMFVLASNAEKEPQLLAQAVADGHEIGSHAYSHTWLNRMTLEECATELDKAEAIITKVAPKPTLFRPPGGAYNDKILEQTKQRGYTTILWSVDAQDWQLPSVAKVVAAVMDNVRPGSIVLFHEGQYPLPTPTALGIIIDQLRANGYQIVTVSELLQYYEIRQ